MLMAGASVVGVGSVFYSGSVVRGNMVMGNIGEELEEIMEKHNVPSIESIGGDRWD